MFVGFKNIDQNLHSGKWICGFVSEWSLLSTVGNCLQNPFQSLLHFIHNLLPNENKIRIYVLDEKRKKGCIVHKVLSFLSSPSWVMTLMQLSSLLLSFILFSSENWQALVPKPFNFPKEVPKNLKTQLVQRGLGQKTKSKSFYLF